MNAVSLFSGCLGLDLGLEELGISSACFVENDKDCLRLIADRRPGARVVTDVRDVDAALERDLGEVDLVAGGFPCQDLSYAGRGVGLDGDRSGLWFEMLRVVEELRPRLVLVENVPGLLTRGLGVVVHGLARAGYVGRWFTLGAVDVGAPHRRERVFVIARRIAEGRGDRLRGGHPVGLFDPSGWLPPQESLFAAEPLARIGKRGSWTLDAVYESDSRLAIDDDSDETLLPTPNAYESTPTEDFVDEMRDAGVDPEARLYLPGRKHHVQRTLSRVAPMLEEVGPLLPTPGANDATGPEGETRKARQDASGGSTGGASLRDLPHLLPTPCTRDGKGASKKRDDLSAAAQDLPVEDLPAGASLLPTPVVTDSFGSRRSTARTDDWTSNPGTTLTDAVWEAQGRETDTTGKLLPTPSAALADGGQKSRGGDRQDELLLGGIAEAAAEGRLLPTPTSEDGERGRNGAGSDRLGAATFDDPLLPSPNVRDHHAQGAGRNAGASQTQLSTVIQKYGLDGIPEEAYSERPAKADQIPLLPTPMANPENPGSGGELRAALEHGPGRRNETGIDSLGRPNAGRPSRKGEKLLPTPTRSEANDGPSNVPGLRDGGNSLRDEVRLLPTPQKSDGDGGRLDRNPETLATGRRPSGSKTSKPLATAIDQEVESLLPTPTVAASRKSTRAMTSSGAGVGNGRRDGGGMSSPPGLEQVAEMASGTEPRDLPAYADLPPETRRVVDGFSDETKWGVYEPAIRRWERASGHPAPAPTDEKGRLSPEFVEWMLGYEPGWTALEGISRTARLRMLGNSVQVQVGRRVGQALLALDRDLSANEV